MKQKCHRVSSVQAEWAEKLKGEKDLMWPRSIWRLLEEEGTGCEIWGSLRVQGSRWGTCGKSEHMGHGGAAGCVQPGVCT